MVAVRILFHCLQQWYCLSNPTMEEELSEIASMRQFAGLQPGFSIPDETTILKFRHLLELHKPTHLILTEVSNYFQEKGLMLRQGSIVDATTIAAPSYTKRA